MACEVERLLVHCVISTQSVEKLVLDVEIVSQPPFLPTFVPCFSRRIVVRRVVLPVMIRSVQGFSCVEPEQCEGVAVQRIEREKDSLKPRRDVTAPLCGEVAAARVSTRAHVLVSDVVFCVRFENVAGWRFHVNKGLILERRGHEPSDVHLSFEIKQ